MRLSLAEVLNRAQARKPNCSRDALSIYCSALKSYHDGGVSSRPSFRWGSHESHRTSRTTPATLWTARHSAPTDRPLQRRLDASVGPRLGRTASIGDRADAVRSRRAMVFRGTPPEPVQTATAG